MTANLKRILAKCFGAVAAIALAGCALTAPPVLKYSVEAKAIRPAGESAYYEDPVDSTIVWSKDGLQIKVRFYND